MVEKWETRMDQLDEKVGQLEHKVDRLDHKVGQLDHKVDRLEQKLDSNHAQLTEMMAQLMRIVGETNHKLSNMKTDFQQLEKDVTKNAKTTELHKRKIADLEEEVNLLKPVEQ